jgi:hypothetical protein
VSEINLAPTLYILKEEDNKYIHNPGFVSSPERLFLSVRGENGSYFWAFL